MVTVLKRGENDFEFIVDLKAQGSAARAFEATALFVEAIERLDNELLATIDSRLRSDVRLVDVDYSSLRSRFTSFVRAIDDEALKNLDFKPAIGKYLVRGKYRVLDWLENDTAPKNMNDLKSEILRLAKETNVRPMGDYVPPSSEGLITSLSRIDDVKGALREEDSAKVLLPDGERYLNTKKRLMVDEIEGLLVKETILNPPQEMLLTIKMPDFLGDAQWKFKHGQAAIDAKVADETWLDKFRAGDVAITPGDSLRAIVQAETDYGYDGELLRQRYVVLEVREIVSSNRNQQRELL